MGEEALSARLLLLSSAAFLSIVSVQAMAQNAVLRSEGQAIALNTISGSVEEIVVTASRRQERLQVVPISVTALTANALANAGISDSRSLTQAIPNLTFSNSNSIFQPNIRGVFTQAVSAGDESSVPVYIDDLYLAEMGSLGFDLLEIERIEVLRGPQGTLFGRNAVGGLIHVITKDPSHDPSGHLSVRYGNFGDRQVRGYGTAGFGDSVAIDLSFLGRQGDGWIDDLLRNKKGNPSKAYAVRSKLLFEGENGLRTTLAVAHDFSRDASANSYFVRAGTSSRRPAQILNPAIIIPTGPFNTAADIEPYLRTKSTQVTLSIHAETSFMDVEGTLGFQDSDSEFRTDVDGTTSRQLGSFVDQSTRAYTGEIRFLSTSSGRFGWIAGVFGIVNNANDGKDGEIRVYSAVTGAPVVFFQPKIRSKSIAGFGEVNYAITPELKITSGLRYTYEEKEFKQYSGVTGAQLVDASDHWGQFTPKASISYQPTQRLNIYASYAKGFKSGSFNTASASAVSVDPEKLDSFEVGLKADPAPWLRANLAVFYYNYKDIQVTARAFPVGFTLQNAATANARGAEVEITAKPAKGLTLRAAGSLFDGKYDSFPGAANFSPIASGGFAQVTTDASGKHLTRTPKYTFNVGGEYSLSLDTDTSAGLSFNLFRSGRRFWTSDNRISSPGYTVVNSTVFWEPTKDLRISIYGNNLFNAKFARQINPNAVGLLSTYEKPRSYGVELRASF